MQFIDDQRLPAAGRGRGAPADDHASDEDEHRRAECIGAEGPIALGAVHFGGQRGATLGGGGRSTHCLGGQPTDQRDGDAVAAGRHQKAAGRVQEPADQVADDGHALSADESAKQRPRRNRRPSRPLERCQRRRR